MNEHNCHVGAVYPVQPKPTKLFVFSNNVERVFNATCVDWYIDKVFQHMRKHYKFYRVIEQEKCKWIKCLYFTNEVEDEKPKTKTD